MKLFYFDEADVNLIIHSLENRLQALKEIQNNKKYKTLRDEAQEYYEHKRLQCDNLLTYIRKEVNDQEKYEDE